MELSNIYFFFKERGIRTMIIQKNQQRVELGDNISRVLGNKKTLIICYEFE